MNFMHWKEVFIKSLTELIMSDTSIGHTRLLETLWGQKTRKVRNRTFFPKGEKSSSQLNLNKGTLLLFCFVKMNEDRCLVQHLSRCSWWPQQWRQIRAKHSCGAFGLGSWEHWSMIIQGQDTVHWHFVIFRHSASKIFFDPIYVLHSEGW